MSPRVVEAIAPAKVNLWLAIRGRRPDGYHELSTIMLALELADRLIVTSTEASAGIALELSGPEVTEDIPCDASNLVWKAAALALERVSELGGEAAPGLHMRLVKRVPSQAGLGGGSSDAVAAILAVESLTGIDLGESWKRDTLAQLGADCAFFHQVGSSALALCEGIGERVSPRSCPRPAWWVALVTPRLFCSTPEVFAALPAERSAPSESPLTDGFEAWPAERVGACLASDLEPAAERALPELLRWRALLDQVAPVPFRLSGSGASFFGLFDDRSRAEEALEVVVAAATERDLGLRFRAVTPAGAGGARLDAGPDAGAS